MQLKLAVKSIVYSDTDNDIYCPVPGWGQDEEIRFNENMNPRFWGEVGGEGEENDCVLIFY